MSQSNPLISPRAVLAQVAAAIPEDCLENLVVIGSLADCAYIITLSVSLLLTTGDSIPNPIHDQIGFCKK